LAPSPTSTTLTKVTTTIAAAPTTVSPTAPSFTDNFNAIPLGATMTPGTATKGWMPQWNGYGSITRVSDVTASLDLLPAAATAPSQTHSSLVTSVATFGSTDLTMNLRTVSQLRQGSPTNPWEVGWAIWHFTDNSHFYYLALKPNGWELGKEDPVYPGSQRFLATGSTGFAVGTFHSVHINQVGNSISVAADGISLATFVDAERPYLNGSIGLYCEDSQVDFRSLSATGQI
jgi:hypothetical protein